MATKKPEATAEAPQPTVADWHPGTMINGFRFTPMYPGSGQAGTVGILNPTKNGADRVEIKFWVHQNEAGKFVLQPDCNVTVRGSTVAALPQDEVEAYHQFFNKTIGPYANRMRASIADAQTKKPGESRQIVRGEIGKVVFDGPAVEEDGEQLPVDTPTDGGDPFDRP